MRGISARARERSARRRIANNTFSLSRELGLPRLLRPGTEAIKLYSQRNQLWEKGEKESKGESNRGKRSVTKKREAKRDRYTNRQRGCDMRQSNPPNSQYRRNPPIARTSTSRILWKDTLRFFIVSFISRRISIDVNPATIHFRYCAFPHFRSPRERTQREISIRFLVLSKSVNLLAWLNSISAIERIQN